MTSRRVQTKYDALMKQYEAGMLKLNDLHMEQINQRDPAARATLEQQIAQVQQACDALEQQLDALEQQMQGTATTDQNTETPASNLGAQGQFYGTVNIYYGNTPAPMPTESSSYDWGEAPDVSNFHGREAERATLAQWLITDRCRLICILGIDGMGKTALAAKAAHDHADNFSHLIWRSLRNASHLHDLLADWIVYLSNKQKTDLPDTTSERITLLVDYLKRQNCLIVLDNVETILRGGQTAGAYREGYELYGELIRQIGEQTHRSVLLLTSSEMPDGYERFEKTVARTLSLTGISRSEAQVILHGKALIGNEADWNMLVDRYSGNPLALKLASEFIRELYGGMIADFLKEGEIFLGEVRNMLDRQLARLSEFEQEVMYWLAIERGPVSIDTLRVIMVMQHSRRTVVEAVVNLRRRSLIERNEMGLTLQNVVMEYVTERLIEVVYDEITSGSIHLLNSHALMRAQAKEYVRNAQLIIFLAEILQKLEHHLGSREAVGARLTDILTLLRYEAQQPDAMQLNTGYLAGNVLNMLVCLGANLTSYDFSNLSVWEAYVQNTELRDVSFKNANFERSVFAQSFGMVHSLAFSPDGNTFVAATSDGQICVWHTATMQQLVNIREQDGWAHTVTYSPDGSLLISGGNRGEIKIWDNANGQLLQTLEGHKDWIAAIAFHTNGTTLLSSSADKTLRVWDIHTGICQKTIENAVHRAMALTVRSDNSEAIVATDGEISTVWLWDFDTWTIRQKLHGHTHRIYALAFNPDSTLLASGSRDETICLWDVKSGQRRQILKGHTGTIYSVAFSYDGHILASAASDYTIRLWDVESGQCLGILRGHVNFVRHIAFHPTDWFLLSGSFDQSLRIWNIVARQCLQTVHGYAQNSNTVALAFHNQYIASTGRRGDILLWSQFTGQNVGKLRGHTHKVNAVAFDSSGQLLASASSDLTVRLWDIADQTCRNVFRGHKRSVETVAISPRGDVVASGSLDSSIRLWDTQTGLCRDVLERHSDAITTVTFSPDVQILASSGYDRFIRLWHTETAKYAGELPQQEGTVQSVVFDYTGQFIVSGGYDRVIRLWDTHSSQCIKTFEGHTNAIHAVVIHPAGHLLASVGRDLVVRLWNIETGACQAILQGHTAWIKMVAFSPDGSMLASSAEDGTVRLWDITSLECVHVLMPSRPYEGMNISGVTGLTAAQLETLKTLGAVESKNNAQ